MILQKSYGSPDHEAELQSIYPQLEKISFDDLVVTKTPKDKAVVLSVDLGWSDVGTWEALKEALTDNPGENLVNGNVALHKTSDSVVYNYTDKLVAGVGLEGMVVVATDDVIMVAPQDKIPEVKKMLATFVGTDKEKYS